MGDERARMLNTRMVMVGGVLTAIGAAICTIGASLAGAAMMSALRQWAQSDQRRELAAKARLASTAAAGAWRGQGPRDVVMPDVAARQPVPSRP